MLSKAIDNCFDLIKTKDVCNSIKKSNNFLFYTDKSTTDVLRQNYLYELKGDLKMGFPRNLYILVRMSNDESNYTEIDLLGIFPGGFIRPSVDSPLKLFQELFKEQQRFNSHNAYQPKKTIQVFKGNVDFDESFNNHISTEIVKLILKALTIVENEVNEELLWLEELAKSKQAFNIREKSGPKNIIIDSL